MGALVHTGVSQTLDHLLAAVRTGRRKHMDYTVRDEFAGVQTKRTNAETITEQIQKGYIRTRQDLEDAVEDEQTVRAQAEFEHTLFEEVRHAAGSEEAVLRQLMNYGQEVTADNLAAAGELLKGSYDGFSRFRRMLGERVLQTEDVIANAPEGFATKDAVGFKGYKYRMQVSPLDCTGCGSCANVCPAKEKALVMTPFEEMEAKEAANWEYANALPKTTAAIANKATVKNSQFMRPYFEFSGACAGCGETPYIKVITQLFGDRMVIANATGCSSIYGGSAPTCPYCVDENGNGPAWANSLFEDNAEFGYGINLAYAQRRVKIAEDMNALIELGYNGKAKDLFTKWLETYKDVEANRVVSEEIKAVIDDEAKNASGDIQGLLTAIALNKDCLVKKSIWIFGGDGWAYDIGFGGLDHVLAMGEDVNVLVVDTEVYSNTGGQASKSSPTGAVAKFAAGGKVTKKKDLGKIAMSYGYVYVAQCSMGASEQQFVNAIKEAESYDGPSLIIAYAPCINHGINMSNSQLEMKRAVEAGYWQLYRYNPLLKDAGKNPFTLDSKEPTANYEEFLLGETRYASLKKSKPAVAEKLFKLNEEQAKARYEGYKQLAEEKKD